jgi:hypothetical protein
MLDLVDFSMTPGTGYAFAVIAVIAVALNLFWIRLTAKLIRIGEDWRESAEELRVLLHVANGDGLSDEDVDILRRIIERSDADSTSGVGLADEDAPAGVSRLAGFARPRQRSRWSPRQLPRRR